MEHWIRLFGTDGIVIGSPGKGASVVVQNDDKILLGGSHNSSFLVERYNASGTVDTTFGIEGKITTLVGSSAGGNSLGIQNDGKILLAGNAYNNFGNADFALVRYTSEGALDDTFGTGGIVTTEIGNAISMGNSMRILSNGNILVAGQASDSANYGDFALVQYASDGTLYDSFGTGGKVITIIGGDYSIGRSLAIQSNDDIVVAGAVYNGSNSDMAVARYSNTLAPVENCCSQWGSSTYPNPFNISATIKFNTPLNNAEIKVYNIYGQEVKQISNISGQEAQIARKGLPDGIYFLQLIVKNKVVSVEKLVINGK